MKKHHIFDRENTFFLIDNLSVHKAGLVREYKRFEGLKVLYNAPLNPDMNPIEIIFHILKMRTNNRTHQTM